MTKRRSPPPKRPAHRARAQNAIAREESGQATQYDFGTNQVPATAWMSPLVQDKICTQLYLTDWAARKIVSIPVDDMLRHGWLITGVSDEQRAKLEAANERLGMLKALRQAMRLERLVGGSVIYLGASDGQEDAARPLDESALSAGSLKFLNVLPRGRVNRVNWATDPLSPDYGRPLSYTVNGHDVHRSRFVIFDGDPLTSMPETSILPVGMDRGDGFGYSVLLSVYDDLTRATGSRQGAYQLLQRASVFLATMDIDSLDGTNQGDVALQKMRNIVNQINLYRGAVLHKDPGDPSSPLSVVAAQFGSVPELVMTFLQVLSAASDIPATRFIGQAPGGLNATGESDLENYYGRIEAEQKQRLAPLLLRLQRMVAVSELGSVPDGLGIEFEPLWSLSATEEADVESKEVATLLSLYDSALVTDAEMIAELNSREIFSVPLSGEDAGREPDPIADPAPLADTLGALNGQA